MNQDKIKQAFEEFASKQNHVSRFPADGYSVENYMEASWLAACEWLMSQGAQGFDEWFNPSKEVPEILKEACRVAWQAAHLSCAKELNEKIDVRSCMCGKHEERIAALEGELAKIYHITKLAHSYDEQFPLAAELASKKEG